MFCRFSTKDNCNFNLSVQKLLLLYALCFVDIACNVSLVGEVQGGTRFVQTRTNEANRLFHNHHISIRLPWIWVERA